MKKKVVDEDAEEQNLPNKQSPKEEKKVDEEGTRNGALFDSLQLLLLLFFPLLSSSPSFSFSRKEEKEKEEASLV